MLTQFTITYDGKNDKYEIQYQNEDHIQLVYVGGLAMNELANDQNMNVAIQQDIGSAIFEYLASTNTESLQASPVFILPEADIGVVNNALAINPELIAICQQYLAE